MFCPFPRKPISASFSQNFNQVKTFPNYKMFYKLIFSYFRYLKKLKHFSRWNNFSRWNVFQVLQRNRIFCRKRQKRIAGPWGRILGRKPDKSLPPCYPQSPLQLCLKILFLQTHATSYNFLSTVSVHCKGERRKIW